MCVCCRCRCCCDTNKHSRHGSDQSPLVSSADGLYEQDIRRLQVPPGFNYSADPSGGVCIMLISSLLHTRNSVSASVCVSVCEIMTEETR